MKKKAIFFCGHMSLFGRATFYSLLGSKEIEIEKIVLADIRRWEIFRSSLVGEVVTFGLTSKLSFYKFVKQIKAAMPVDCKMDFIHDANCELLKLREYDIVISSAYPQIFSKKFIDITRLAINFHPSYLPKCRGAHPVYWTIASGEKQGGITCHVLTSGIDEGGIISRILIDLSERSTYNELYKKIVASLPILIGDLDQKLRNGLSPIPQGTDFTYYRNDRAYHRKIYWTIDTSEDINLKIRAGGCYCFDKNGVKLTLKRGEIVPKNNKYITNGFDNRIESGTIIGNIKEGFIVKTLNGLIIVEAAPSLPRFKRIIAIILGKKYTIFTGERLF